VVGAFSDYWTWTSDYWPISDFWTTDFECFEITSVASGCSVTSGSASAGCSCALLLWLEAATRLDSATTATCVELALLSSLSCYASRYRTVWIEASAKFSGALSFSVWTTTAPLASTLQSPSLGATGVAVAAYTDASWYYTGVRSAFRNFFAALEYDSRLLPSTMTLSTDLLAVIWVLDVGSCVSPASRDETSLSTCWRGPVDCSSTST